MSTSTLYSLEVEYKHGTAVKRKLIGRAPRHYAQVRLHNTTERSPAMRPPAWHHTFSLLSSDPTSDLTIEVFQSSFLGKKHSSVGEDTFKLGKLFEKSKNEGECPKFSLRTGDLHLRLKVIDKITSAAIRLRNTGIQTGNAEAGRLSKTMKKTSEIGDIVASQLIENGDLYQDIGNLLLKLAVFAKVAGDFAAIEPHLNAAWTAASILYKAISNQIKTDERVINLMKALLEKFNFVNETKSLRNKTYYLQSAITKLLEVTKRCCVFIKRYFQRWFIRRMLSLKDNERITRFEQSIDSLTKQFEAGTKSYDEALQKQANLETILKPSDMSTSDRPRCLEGTQIRPRSEIHEWIESNSRQNVYWMHGVAGSGKSTIATTVADELRESRQLGAFLFFGRAAGKPEDVFNRKKSDPKEVIRTIAHQLAKSNPVTATHVAAGVLGDTLDSSLQIMFKRLILEPLNAAAEAPNFEGPIVIMLDALDECGDPSTRANLMDVFKANFSNLPSGVRIFVTSRPEPDLQAVFSDAESVLTVKLDHETQTSRQDVSMFISHELNELFINPKVGTQPVPENWPLAENIKLLGETACGLFVWASTSVRYIKNSTHKEFHNFDQLIKAIKSNRHPRFGLDDLYSTVLNGVKTPWEDGETFSRILYLILVVDVALSTRDIDIILGLSEQTSSSLVLSDLQSVLAYTPGSRSRIRPLHASFSDFLKSKDQEQQTWHINVTKNSEYFTQRCLDSFDTMDRLLRFNICDLETSYKSNADIPNLQSRIEEKIPDSLTDACLSWAHQLSILPFSSTLADRLSRFLHTHLLFWLEVLSLIGKADFATLALAYAIRWTAGHDTWMEPFMRDARKVITAFNLPISESLPHIYVSMIPLAWQESQMATHYSQFISSGLKAEIKGVRPQPALPDIFKGHTDAVNSVSFSPDGKRVVSGSRDKTLIVWDIESGEIIAGPFEGHTDEVNSVSFSPGGKRIVSGSSDNTLIVWDAESGKAVAGPFKGHTGSVKSVSFAPDGKRVVSGSRDKTLIVWDIESGEITAGPFGGHTWAVNSVSFSPDGKRIVSGSDDNTLIVWDAKSGEVVAGPLKGHSDRVRCVSFSPDGKRIVSGSDDETLVVWDAESGKVVAGPSKGHAGAVRSVLYSPDGKRIVSGSHDRTLIIWDAKSGKVIAGPFGGHAWAVNSVSFSPDGKRIVSGSDDNILIVWDAESGKNTAEPFEGHSDQVNSVSFSPDGKRIVSGSDDKTLIVWDAESSKIIAGPFKGHSGPVRSVSYSPDGKHIVSGSDDCTLIIWDAESGKIIAGPFKEHTDQVNSVSFSSDGKRIVSGSGYKRLFKPRPNGSDLTLWDAESGKVVVCPLQGYRSPINSVSFSPDGKRIVSGSNDYTLTVRDADSGNIIAGPFRGHSGFVRSVSFSPDGKRIVSGSGDKTLIVWDAESGKIIAGPFKRHSAHVRSVSYSPDGKHIVSGSHDRTLIIWDADSDIVDDDLPKEHSSQDHSIIYSPDRKQIASDSDNKTIGLDSESGKIVAGPFEGHTGEIYSVAYSPNGENIVSASSDHTIRMWSARNAVVPSASSESNISSNWTTSKDGWILGEEGELLAWVPPDMRKTLWTPRTTAIFSCRFTTKFDFMGSEIGEKWKQCFNLQRYNEQKEKYHVL